MLAKGFVAVALWNVFFSSFFLFSCCGRFGVLPLGLAVSCGIFFLLCEREIESGRRAKQVFIVVESFPELLVGIAGGGSIALFLSLCSFGWFEGPPSGLGDRAVPGFFGCNALMRRPPGASFPSL